MKAVVLAVAALLGAAGCGSSGGGGPHLTETTYSYAANQQITVAPGDCTLVVGPVSVNGSGSMYYQVNDPSGTDALTLVVLPHSFFYYESCAFTSDQTLYDASFVGSKSDRFDMTADSYDLVVTCGNPAGGSCVFTLTWNATY
ncbi:MAG TPA: hypothetical protein VKZ18_16580 [Polyangia bacterium]|nr:hypothetical protein [Polyangia bacterium]